MTVRKIFLIFIIINFIGLPSIHSQEASVSAPSPSPPIDASAPAISATPQNTEALSDENNEITLRSGWYANDPYQFTEGNEGTETSIKGLDIELTKAISEVDNSTKISYQPIAWKQQQLNLRNGTQDIACGATFTKERAEYVYFSDAYREEEDSCFIREDLDGKIDIHSVKDFIAAVKKFNLKFGIIDGFIYADPQLNVWLNEPANARHIIRSKSDQDNIKILVNGKIDAFLADRIVGATLIWRQELGRKIVEKRLNISTPIYYMFSKKSVSPEFVAHFNKAIVEVKQSHTYQKIIAWYWQPILLLQTIDSSWFNVIEILGTIAFAISGLVIAYREKTTLFGAFIFAILPSLGGGIIRDVIYGRHPIGAMSNPGFLELVIAIVGVGYLAIQLYPILKARFKILTKFNNPRVTQYVLVVCDAMGLAAFTVVGILVSLMSKADPLWLWGAFFAFVTGAGGGILRDLISKSQTIMSFQGSIYPELAVIWGGALSAFLMWQANSVAVEPIQISIYVTVIGVFISRLLVYYFNVPNVHFYIYTKKQKEIQNQKDFDVKH